MLRLYTEAVVVIAVFDPRETIEFRVVGVVPTRIRDLQTMFDPRWSAIESTRLGRGQASNWWNGEGPHSTLRGKLLNRYSQ